MPASRNLIFAEAAVKSVEPMLRGKSANKTEDLFHSVQENIRKDYSGKSYMIDAILENESIYDGIPHKIKKLGEQRSALLDTLRETRNLAGKMYDSKTVKEGGIGNCEEHSIMAMKYLQSKSIPSHLASTTDWILNHVFVVIGLGDQMSNTKIHVPIHKTPPEPFGGANVVICDPWYHEWYHVCDNWVPKMRLTLCTTLKEFDNDTQTLHKVKNIARLKEQNYDEKKLRIMGDDMELYLTPSSKIT